MRPARPIVASTPADRDEDRVSGPPFERQRRWEAAGAAEEGKARPALLFFSFRIEAFHRQLSWLGVRHGPTLPDNIPWLRGIGILDRTLTGFFVSRFLDCCCCCCCFTIFFVRILLSSGRDSILARQQHWRRCRDRRGQAGVNGSTEKRTSGSGVDSVSDAPPGARKGVRLDPHICPGKTQRLPNRQDGRESGGDRLRERGKREPD